MGLINPQGQEILPLEFDAIEDFRVQLNGMARIRMGNEWGLIDQAGKVVLNPTYALIEDFSDQLGSMARVNLGGKWNSRYKRVDGGKWGLIDQALEIILEPSFDRLSLAEGGYLMQGLVNGELRMIDEEWEVYTPKSLHPKGVLGQHFEGLIAIEQNGKLGFMRQNTQIAIPPQFDYIGTLRSDGLLLVSKNGSWSLINRSGGIVNELGKYSQTKPFSQTGLAWVESRGKWGLIDETGEVILKPQFDQIQDFSDKLGGMTRVQKSRKYGLLD